MLNKFRNKTAKILSDLYPKSWMQQLKDTEQQIDILEFNNLTHFKQYLKGVKLNENGSANQQDVPFAEALQDLVQGKSVLNSKKFDIIKNEVLNEMTVWLNKEIE